jgi:hypothetical protein
MKPIISSRGVNRRVLLSALAALPTMSGPLLTVSAEAQTATSADALASCNSGPPKQAIVDFVRATFVRATTDRASPTFVSPEERIATFDQDGTLWVEHPMYSQVINSAAIFESRSCP